MPPCPRIPSRGGGTKKTLSGFPPTQLTMDCSTSSIPPHPTSHPSNTINGLPLRCGKKKRFFWRDEHTHTKKKNPTGKEKSTLTSSVGQPKQILRRKSWRSPSMPPPPPNHTAQPACVSHESWPTSTAFFLLVLLV